MLLLQLKWRVAVACGINYLNVKQGSALANLLAGRYQLLNKLESRKMS
jgi:hypothetical protein